MRASTIMLIAVGAALIGRWANNKKALPSAKGVVEIVFAIVVIAVLDQGNTEGIAKGFAWLFLAAVLLSNDSPLTGIAKAGSPAAKSAPAPPKRRTPPPVNLV